MSKATAASTQTKDPGYAPDTSAVTKSTTKQGSNDTVTVAACEDGNDSTPSRNAVVVLQISSDGKSTASVNSTTGAVTLTATGSGTKMYIVVTLNTSDSGNWTVYVNTSGGTNYTFTKGSGGGGHKAGTVS